MNLDDFNKLLNILEVVGIGHYYTDEKTMIIETPEERDYNLVDAMLTDYVEIGEWYNGVDEDYIEIPESELPEEIIMEMFNNEQEEV